MFQNLNVLKAAISMARHAGYKQALISQNIANADTPGFVARDVKSFSKFVPSSLGGMELKTTHAKHSDLVGGRSVRAVRMGSTDPNGNGVVLENEILASVDARRQHDRALSIYQASLGMLRSTLSKQ